MNCQTCRFRKTLCYGSNEQEGVPWPWRQFFLHDADEFQDEVFWQYPDVTVCTEPPPKAIPQVDGRVGWLEDLEWVSIRLAQVFETKRRKAGWKSFKNLRGMLQLAPHTKMYFAGCGKDDQLWHMMQDPHWAERLVEYGIDYASPLNFSMYHNSTACQIVWSLLMSWRSAKMMSKAGLKIIPNIEGPENVQKAQWNWIQAIHAPTIMTNFQMVYNQSAFERELAAMQGFVTRWRGRNIILNGVTHSDRIRALNKLHSFSYVSATLYSYAWYRRRWNPQGGFTRETKSASPMHVMELFKDGFLGWKALIEGGQYGSAN